MSDDTPTPFQRELAELLGISISRDSEAVAAARLYDVVGPAVDKDYEVRSATKKQIAFARSLGIDVSEESLRVASARIGDALLKRNRKRLAELDLKPGDRVHKTSTVEINGEFILFTREFTVSSIGKDCRIYFKGGKGAGAWPSQVERVRGAGK